MTNDNTRRGFLGTAAGIAGWSMAGAVPASAKTEPAPWGIKLGVATYSLRSFDRTKAIEMIKVLQTPYVSIKEFHLKYVSTPDELAAGRKEFEDAGLKIMSGGNVDLKSPDPAVLKKSFEYAKGAGMPMMVCAPTRDNLKTLEALVKEYNIGLAIHNHGPEDKGFFPSPYDVMRAVEKFDKRIGLCIDVGHTARAGVDPAESILKCQERLYDLHMKDISALGNRNTPIEGGRGILDSRSILDAILKIKYQGLVGFEYEKDGKDPVPGLAESVGYVKGILVGMK